MAILAECPVCHNKQSIKNKACKCGQNLDAAKKTQKVRYWIKFRLPDGTQKKEYVGMSIEEARDADGKRRGQKRENRIFDILEESKITFQELTDWYLELKKVKKLRSYIRVQVALKRFNEVFGEMLIIDLKNEDLENYQEAREEKGASPATIDMELTIAQTMVNKAFDNDKIDGRALKPFRRTDRKLRKGSNARNRTVSVKEYLALVDKAMDHLKGMLIVAYNTGMRVGEVKTLRWSHIDSKTMFIRLPETVTKEKRTKDIPINHHVKGVLDMLKPPIGIVKDGYHDFVFTYLGNPMTSPGGVRKSFKAACEGVGIIYGERKPGGLVFKDFRRSVKTNMAAAELSKVYRDTILGHTLQGMDVHYIKPSDADLTKAMEKYTRWLDGEMKKVKGPHIGSQMAKNEKDGSGKT